MAYKRFGVPDRAPRRSRVISAVGSGVTPGSVGSTHTYDGRKAKNSPVEPPENITLAGISIIRF
jgi:hypothetical protein